MSFHNVKFEDFLNLVLIVNPMQLKNFLQRRITLF